MRATTAAGEGELVSEVFDLAVFGLGGGLDVVDVVDSWRNEYR